MSSASDILDTALFIPPAPAEATLAPAVQAALDRMAQSVGAGRSLDDVLDVVWQETTGLLPRDRLGLAFIEEDGQRVVSRYARAEYTPIRLVEGYASGLANSSLQTIIDTGQARIIQDLSVYLEAHPESIATRLLVQEDVRSSLTLPLRVGERAVGFLFISSRGDRAYGEEQARLVLTVLERIAQAVEKAWIIKQLEDAKAGYLSMLGFVAHEMKSPLASLMARGETYVGGYLGETQPVAVETMRKMMNAAGYLINMVNNYLDLARLESGEMKYKPADDVCFREDVLQFAVDTVAIRAGQRGSEIVVTSDVPEVVLHADADLLRIVMINLVDNAVKYGHDNIQVQVHLAVEGGSLLVKVRNAGVGFTKAQAAKLFKRFSRLYQKGTEDRRGSGLGLYLTWWIVQKHGGRLYADSEPGAWAEFTVKLPRARSA